MQIGRNGRHAPYVITVHPQKRGEYVSELYAGLFELSAAGEIVIHFSRQPRGRTPERGLAITLRIDLEVRGAPRALKVCFDTADWRTIASMDDLQTVDVYFKRSYHLPFVEQLEPSLRGKILPMGLHYGCTSRYESFGQSLRDVLAHELASGAIKSAPLAAATRIAGVPLRQALAKRGLWNQTTLPMYIDEFEVDPRVPTQSKIFYRTRVYGPKDAPDTFRLRRINEFNAVRADTVRALKKHFGPCFIGGLRDSDYARETYPDCVFHDDLGVRGHLELSKACLVGVNASGLHDSTSWKIPEYLAGSRCIVSEPTLYETPVPLVEGIHYLPFRSTEECVAACERLLGDTALSHRMRCENFAYYSAHIRPDRLMSRCLQSALSRCA